MPLKKRARRSISGSLLPDDGQKANLAFGIKLMGAAIPVGNPDILFEVADIGCGNDNSCKTL